MTPLRDRKCVQCPARLAMVLRREHEDVRLSRFLMGDAATYAFTNQTTADGYDNRENSVTIRADP